MVPTTPGVLSALGGLIADLKNDFVSTIYADLDATALADIQSGFERLRELGGKWLRDEQSYTGPVTYLYSGDMRYRGQSFEIEAFLDPQDVKTGDIVAMAESFHAAHEQIYTHADRDAPVQIINLRLVAMGKSPKPKSQKTLNTLRRLMANAFSSYRKTVKNLKNNGETI